MKATAATRREIWVRLLLYPGHTLPTAAAPVAVGVGLAIHDHVFAFLPVLLAFVGSWLIHVGGVFADNHELLRKHPGVPEHPELLRALANGTLTLNELKWAIAACFGLPVLIAPYMFRIGGVAALAIGVAGALASAAYAAGPWPYARRGWAETVFLLMFGVVAVVGTYYAQMVRVRGAPADWSALWRALPLSVFIVGLPVGALVTNVLVIDDIRDREFDAQKGWRTTAVRFGLSGSRIEYVALSIFAYLAPLWFWLGLGYSAWVLLPLLTLPLAYHIGGVVRAKEQTKDLFHMTPRASLLAFLWSILLAIGVALF
jgi:1,4-dihydroxy-2-naphthoate polyprenyltransferase